MFVNDDLRGRVMSTYQLAAVGMTPLRALEAGGAMVGDEVAISIDVEAIKK